MKKVKFLLMIAMAFVLAGATNVSAITASTIDGSGASTSQEGEYTRILLEENVSHDLEIGDGEKVVLDLNGYTLTNYTDGCSAIYIKDGGELIITSSQEGGKINQKSTSTAPVVNNDGTLIIEEGTIEASARRQAAVYNAGDVTVCGGTITTTGNDIFGFTNEGTATIAGGNFIQAYNYSIINNANVMKIQGGNFEISTGNTNAYSLITNQGSANKASLEVTAGTFKANANVFFNDDEDTIAISGGSYSHDISEYVADGYTMTEENGQFVLNKDEEVKEPESSEPGKEDTTIEENPNTYDNILVYVGLALFGSIALGYSIKKATTR